MNMQDNMPRQTARRLAGIPAWTYLAVFGPADQSYYNRYLQRWIDRTSTWRGVTGQQGELEENVEELASYRFSRMLSKLALPALRSAFNRAALVQTTINQARIACGLERYYLARREYPKELAALVPEYLSALQGDLIDGQPMRYERTSATAYRLWSIGVDGKDDGGKPSDRKKYEVGDWVWGMMP
jgi:hypothetical protein